MSGEGVLVSEPEAGSGWAGRTVLVTGAGGFIGSHLVEALVSAGADVRAFVRYNSRNDYGWLERAGGDLMGRVEVFRGDLANPEAVAGAVEGRDTIVHLGALIPIPYSYRHPREYLSTNIEGALNMLEACRRSKVRRVVHVSSSEVYGTALQVPIDESHPLQAQSPYAASKVAADQLALSYWRSFGTPVVIARPFNTYGPRQSARAVIPTIIIQSLDRGAIELGSLSPTRDFLFVEDTVAGLMRCAEAPGVEGEVINLGTGSEISVGDLVSRVLSLTGREVPLALEEARLRPAGSEVERLLADCTKARDLLGWQAQVDLNEGLRRTIEWFSDSLETYKSGIYNV